MGMNPDAGRSLWLILHIWADGLPNKLNQSDLVDAHEFLWSFKKLVQTFSGDCDCMETLNYFLSRNPLPRTRGRIVAWCEDLHNLVNKKLGKPVYLLGVSKSKLYSDCGCG